MIYFLFFYISFCFDADDMIYNEKYQYSLRKLNWLWDNSCLISSNSTNVIEWWNLDHLDNIEYLYVLDGCNYFDGILSPNKIFLAIPCQIKTVIKFEYRYSYSASYMFYNLFSKLTFLKLLFRDFFNVTRLFKEYINFQYFNWVGKIAAYTFVMKNNVYFAENPYSTPIKITHDGIPDSIYNGIPDWVYEGTV
ncbi:hypothetical protein HZS_117 [Henneguya salminicola]|nr:hypothetical protein HZS_117 [Henneguya salminicola]